jgi:hypothetical protein
LSEIEYLRRQMARLRELARTQVDPAIRQELLALAEECEKVAGAIAGRRNGGHP